MAGLDSRYFYYQLLARRSDLEALGQGSTFQEFSSQAIAILELIAPSVELQRAIADFLDDETARIDGLIEKRRRMIDLLGQRRSAIVEGAIREVAARGVVPLRHIVRRIEVGIVVTPAAWYAEEGVLALRGVNIRPGRIVLDDVVRLTPEGHLSHPTSQLRTGDVVVVRTGQAGAAAVVPPELAGANCIDLVIVRPGPRLVPEFLEFVLNSDWSQKHIDANSVGTIQSHFNVGAMKSVPVPVPSLEEQRRIVATLGRDTSAIDLLVSRMHDQIALLRERRQALITAAVTGQLDVEKRSA